MAKLANQNNIISNSFLDEGESFYKHEGTTDFDLADDNGYAYHKIAAWVVGKDGKPYIKTSSIPSRAQMGRVNVAGIGGEPVGLYEIEETYYTVGENVPEPESIRNANYCNSELNNVLVSNAIQRAGFKGESIRLSTGLPLKQYFNSEGEVNSKLISQVEESLKPLAQPKGVENQSEIVEHIVYAESLSAYVDWYLNDEGEVVKTVRNGVVVVDVGGGTTDISFITPQNEIYMPGSDTKRVGILDVFKKLKTLMAKEYDIDDEFIRQDMLDVAIRTNTFNVRGHDHDCTALVNEAKRFVALRLKNFIGELINDTLDRIIFVGGGAVVLREELLNLEGYADGFVEVPEEPQYANVRGMLKLMTFLDNQE